jgi:ferritin-like metal-binding protein YciE
MATTKTLNDLKALPKMAKAAQNEELKEALLHHPEENPGPDGAAAEGF